MTKAFDAGGSSDIADVYARGASETLMGKSLKKFPRHRLVISSKVYWPMSDDINDRGLSRKHIIESAHRKEPETHRHWTTSTSTFAIAGMSKPPVEETMRAMDDLQYQGKGALLGHERMVRDAAQASERCC
ncbi:MAG: aldo/keto reductase [Polyangiaceae bacterium]